MMYHIPVDITHSLGAITWIAAIPDAWDRRLAIMLAHGAGQDMHSPFMSYFHAQLAMRGFLSVKFNFEYTEQKRRVPDPQPKLRALYRRMIDAAMEKYSPELLVIGGKSMGGRMASYIANDSPAVNGLVFLGYPLHPPGRPGQLRDEHLYSVRVPMLFISGTRDTLASQHLLDQVARKIGDRATMIWIEGGDHSLKVGKSSQESLLTAVEAIEGWTRRLSF